MKLCQYLLIIGNLTAEADACLKNYTPYILQGDNVLCVFIYVCYFRTVVSCSPGKAEGNLRRTFMFTPQHGLCLLPDPHCELRMSMGFNGVMLHFMP